MNDDPMKSAFDSLAEAAKKRQESSGARFSDRTSVTASHGSIAAGRDVYLGQPAHPNPLKRWLRRWLVVPAALAAGLTMAILLAWAGIEANAALEAGYSAQQLLLGLADTTPVREAFGAALAVGVPPGLAAGWAWAFLKG